MRKFVGATLVIAMLLASAGFVHSGNDKDARAIIDKAVKAVGGEAKVAQLKALTWKEKGTYYGMGDGLPYTGIYSVQWPGQFRMEIEGVFTIILNDDKGWTQAAGTTKEMTKEELALQVYNQRAGWISSLVPLKDKAFQLKTLDDAKVGDKAAKVVQVSRKDYPDVKLYFAKDSGLLIKNEFRTKAAEQEFKEVTQSTYYSEHRDVDGAKLPHKLVVKRDGKVYVESENSDMKTADKLDAKVFARPAD